MQEAVNETWHVGDGSQTVLVLDDDALVRNALVRTLRRRSVDVLEAADPDQAWQILGGRDVDLVICDHRLEAGSGVDFLAGLRERRPGVGRVLISGADDPGTARDAINRAGVSYILSKPWDEPGLSAALSSARRGAESAPREGTAASPVVDARFPEIIGNSTPIRELLDLVARVAATDSTVLVTGETGTGKELIGHAIHRASRRRSRVFSAVNSAAIPESLLESELFGHRRGSFTGASSNTKGLFEQADHGTVFLDEVGEMPLSMQAKLLRFLQTGEVRPIGGDATRVVDVRLVTATNRSLEDEVALGRFREDLYYRLAVIPIQVPALRERPEDIPVLARHFLERMAEKVGKRVFEIDDAALDVLQSHDWPGNVRELENAIERGVALCVGDRVTAEDLPRLSRQSTVRAVEPSIESLPVLERRHIIETLDRVGWNRRRAAELLQISTTTLWRRLKEFGIEGRPRTGRAPLGR